MLAEGLEPSSNRVLSRSPLPIGSRQQSPQFSIPQSLSSSLFFGTGGGIRTLINWFLRPAPLPGWATPVLEDRELRIKDGWCDLPSSILNPPSSIGAAIRFSNNKRSGPLCAHSTEAARSLSLFGISLRFRERESAPTGSTTAIIGELSFCRLARAHEALAARLHIQM